MRLRDRAPHPHPHPALPPPPPARKTTRPTSYAIARVKYADRRRDLPSPGLGARDVFFFFLHSAAGVRGRHSASRRVRSGGCLRKRPGPNILPISYQVRRIEKLDTKSMGEKKLFLFK